MDLKKVAKLPKLDFIPARLFKKVRKAPGTAPGSLIFTGKAPEKTTISLIDYTRDKVIEKEVKDVKECFKFKTKKSVTWINIDGFTPEIIETLGKHYGLHPLLLEDVLDVEQRPKTEEYDSAIFVILKMLRFDKNTKKVGSEQISVVLGKNFVVTFQERPGDVFDPVRERIREGKSKRIRNLGADYLAYALTDVIVDNYFVALEGMGELLEDLEKELLEDPSEKTLHKIQNLKRDLLLLRKAIWPVRELASQLTRIDNRLVKPETQVFLRDVYDHIIQVIDTVETFRDMAGGMYDTYLSSVNNRMSEVMKVLTIIATIFIPLTFVAGIYGMNFNTDLPGNMPELNMAYAYPIFWGIMILLTLMMVVYFRRKNWF